MQKFWHLFNWNFAQVETAEEWGAGRGGAEKEAGRVGEGVGWGHDFCGFLLALCYVKCLGAFQN